MTETEAEPNELDSRNLIADIVGHPRCSPCLEELEFMNPGMSSEEIREHLQSLVDDGVVQVLDADTDGVEVENPPEEFYEITQDARERFVDTGEYPREAWAREYESVVKTERVETLQELSRPA